MARRRIDKHWPQDLVNDILLKLPAKSIIRFKCVAKNWNSLFQNPNFVSQHLSISKKVNNRILIHHFDDDVRRYVIRLFPDQTLDSGCQHQDLFEQIPRHFDTPNVVGAHDGLLCLSNASNSRISLWNPATRKFRFLPECNENIPPNVRTYEHNIGFGSDPLTNDYKVIYIRSYEDLETELHIAVYTMSTDSWRLLKVGNHDFINDVYIPLDHSNICVNGVYYWIATMGSSIYYVLAFNFSNESFQLIKWPVFEPTFWPELHRLPDNRLSLWYPDDVSKNCKSFDSWVLNEDGRNWTKLLTIRHVPKNVVRMLGFSSKKDNEVYVQYGGGKFLVYNLDTRKFKDTGVKINTSGKYSFEVYPFEYSFIDVSRDQVE